MAMKKVPAVRIPAYCKVASCGHFAGIALFQNAFNHFNLIFGHRVKLDAAAEGFVDFFALLPLGLGRTFSAEKPVTGYIVKIGELDQIFVCRT